MNTIVRTIGGAIGAGIVASVLGAHLLASYWKCGMIRSVDQL